MMTLPLIGQMLFTVTFAAEDLHEAVVFDDRVTAGGNAASKTQHIHTFY